MSESKGQRRGSDDHSDSKTKKGGHWWNDMFHWSSHKDEISPFSSASSSHTGSREGIRSTSESKEAAAEEWRKERRHRAFLGGW